MIFGWDGRGDGPTPDIRQKQKQSPDWDCETGYGCQAVSPTVKIFLGWHIICNFGQTHGMGPGIRGGGSLTFWLLDTCRQTTNSQNLKSIACYKVRVCFPHHSKSVALTLTNLTLLNDLTIFGNLIYKHQVLFLQSTAVRVYAHL